MGARIGGGAYKDAYAAAGDPNAVVRVLKGTDPHSLEVFRSEHEQYKTLARYGVPVPRIIAEGQVNGHYADVVERYSFSNRDAALFQQQGPAILATPTAHADLLAIRQAITKGVVINDLQFLLKPGHIVVNDPLGISTPEQHPGVVHNNNNNNNYQLQMVDGLIRQGGHQPPPN
jgi:hypothetical protein